MTIVPNEMLMAYADGELAPEECRKLEALLAEDPGLMARLEPFVVTGSPLGDLYARPLNEPIPARLLATVLDPRPVARASRSPAGGARTAPKRATPLSGEAILDAIGDFFFPAGLKAAGAFSIAALVAVGAVAGWGLHGAMSPDMAAAAIVALEVEQGQLVASGALARVLEHMPSGQPDGGEGQGEASIRPVMSFRAGEHGFCRQYEMGALRLFAGVACRGGDKVWRVALHTEAAPAASVGAGDYQSADRPGGSPALDALVGAIMTGDALGGEDEVALIAGGWSDKTGN